MFVPRKIVNKPLAEVNHDLFSDSTRDVHARFPRAPREKNTALKCGVFGAFGCRFVLN